MQTTFQKAVAIAIFAVSPLFFWGGPDYYSARWLTELWNLGHVLFFFLLSILVISSTENSGLTLSRRLILCATLTVLLGAIIEIVQHSLPGRTSSLLDLLRDVSGCIIALLVVLIKEVRTNILRVLGIACIFVTLAVASFSFAVMLKDELAARNEFPVLAGFEHPGELQRWEEGSVKLSRVSSPVRTGHYALQITFSTAGFSGLSLVYFPHDWRGYDTLCFSVYNPGEPVTLHFRVHDALHRDHQQYDERYNATVLVEEGWNDIRVAMNDIRSGPKRRQMDMAAIQGFGLFVMEQQASLILYLDDVRLE